MTTRLLFVCLGNICRSPSAENIMNYLLAKQGLQSQISCDSAGTSSYHIGSRPDSRMAAAAKKHGINLVGHARQFTTVDFEEFDLILAMDDSNYHNILALDSSDQYASKVKRMCDFCQEYPDREVPDPYYGGTDGFDYVINLLMDACGGLIKELEV